MKHIPNLLSMSRIALCLPLLLVDAMTMPFWVLYVIAGTTDMLDGFLARRWGVESKFGARNAICSYVVKHRIEYLHTKANKVTGFLLFIGVMTIGQSYFVPVAWMISCIALFAAIQEGHLIRSNQIYK